MKFLETRPWNLKWSCCPSKRNNPLLQSRSVSSLLLAATLPDHFFVRRSPFGYRSKLVEVCLDAWTGYKATRPSLLSLLGLAKQHFIHYLPLPATDTSGVVYCVACNKSITSTLAVKGAAASHKQLTWYMSGLLPQERGKGGTPSQATNQSLEDLQFRQLCAPAGRTCTNSHMNVVQ